MRLTSHTRTSSHLFAGTQTQSSCCCSSSVLASHGSSIQSDCTLSGRQGKGQEKNEPKELHWAYLPAAKRPRGPLASKQPEPAQSIFALIILDCFFQAEAPTPESASSRWKEKRVQAKTRGEWCSLTKLRETVSWHIPIINTVPLPELLICPKLLHQYSAGVLFSLAVLAKLLLLTKALQQTGSLHVMKHKKFKIFKELFVFL